MEDKETVAQIDIAVEHLKEHFNHGYIVAAGEKDNADTYIFRHWGNRFAALGVIGHIYRALKRRYVHEMEEADRDYEESNDD